MKALIFESNRKLQLFIRNNLVERGYHPVVTDDFAEIHELLSDKAFHALILDCTTYPQETLDLVHTIREIDLFFSLKIYIASPKPSREYALNLIKAGIDGFIIKPFSEEKFNTLFDSMISYSYSGNRRRFIRIKPKESETAFAHIVSPHNGAMIETKILNISLGGIAVILPQDIQNPERIFQMNDVIQNCKLYLNNSLAVTTVMAIVMLKGRIGFRFLHLEENSKNILCNYIYDNLSFVAE